MGRATLSAARASNRRTVALHDIEPPFSLCCSPSLPLRALSLAQPDALDGRYRAVAARPPRRRNHPLPAASTLARAAARRPARALAAKAALADGRRPGRAPVAQGVGAVARRGENSAPAV
eukprot:3158822-Prymnesium_polylepis.3